MASYDAFNAKDPDALASLLSDAQTAQQLAAELGSTRPDASVLADIIAYSFVAERPAVLGYPFDMLHAGTISSEKFMEYYASPVEFTRGMLRGLFIQAFSTGRSRIDGVRVESIDRIVSTNTPVRSIMSVAGRRQEVFWVWEHGTWRIFDASLEQALAHRSH